MKSKHVLVILFLFTWDLLIITSLKVTRKHDEDLFMGHQCKNNAHDTGNGACECNYGYNTYYGNTASFSCMKDNELHKKTGCEYKGVVQNGPATIVENVFCHSISIRGVNIWNVNQDTTTAIWDARWNKTLFNKFSVIKPNKLQMNAESINLDGVLLQVKVGCVWFFREVEKCILISFNGTAQYPITSLNKSTMTTSSVPTLTTTEPLNDSSTEWIIIGGSVSGVVSLMIIVLCSIFFVCKRKKKNKGPEIGVYEETPNTLNQTKKTNEIKHYSLPDEYNELDEDYQNREIYYQSLTVPDKQQVSTPIYNVVQPIPNNKTSNDSDNIYETAGYNEIERKNEQEQQYHELELEPEYRELDSNTYEET